MVERIDREYSVRRRYFTSSPVKFDWFEKTINYISSLWAPVINFHGSYDLRSFFYGESFRVENLEAWISHIQQNWSNVAESDAHFRNQHNELTFRYDHQRSIVDLNVSSSSIEECTSILTDMEKDLKLIQIQENPYRYRKSAAICKVLDWDRKSFADAIKVLLEELFKGQKPFIGEASVTKSLSNNIERLQGFHDISSYLDLIEDTGGSAIKWTTLYVEGSNGIAFGITFNKKSKRIEFRSSISPNELEEKIIKPFKERLQLKLIKGEPTGSGISDTTQSKEEKWWVKYAVNIMITIIGSLAGILLLLKAFVPQYSLEITHPGSLYVEVSTPTLELKWHLWPAGWLCKPDYQASASIFVYYPGKPASEFSSPDASYQVQFEYGEGEYYIVVQPDKKAQPVGIEVVYEAEPSVTESVSP